MRVFVYEYTCANGAAPALHAEGWAMLRAVSEDLTAADLRPITLLAPAFPCQPHAECRRNAVEATAFQELAASADQCLIIAPETSGILEERCRWVEQAGGRLLGPPASVVARLADKLLLGRELATEGICVPALHQDVAGDVRVVVKPRRGAGAQATFRADCAADLAALLPQARAAMPGEDFIIQSFVPGVAASVAFLVGPREIVPLLAGRQHVSASGWLTYQGGMLPLPAPLAERALRLGRRAIEAVRGLRGYIGVDLVLHEATDGSQDAVIEMNPRLTTSYIGLRRLARFNVAEAIVRVACGEKIAPLRWHTGRVEFRTDGSVASVRA